MYIIQNNAVSIKIKAGANLWQPSTSKKEK